nr:hypothetical protein [uncultured Draconibacterium sp.]
MNTEKSPTITRELLEKSTSDEAIEKLRQIDFEYQSKRQELDNIQQVQDGNFYMGKLIGLHNENGAKSYAANREHAQILLYDHYIDQAETVYDTYHPQDTDLEPEHEADKSMAEFQKGYNEAYILFQENAQLAQSLDKSFEDKELSRAEGFQKCSDDLMREKVTQEMDNLGNRSLDKNMDKSRERNTDKDKD